MEYKIITYWFLLTILIDIVLLTDDRVLPDSCKILSTSQCRINSAKCSMTALFTLQRPLSRRKDYGVSWMFNGNIVSGQSIYEFGAKEMTENCTKCSASLLINAPLQRHHYGNYTFILRRLRQNQMSRRTNCSFRLCEDCSLSPNIDQDTRETDKQNIYIYIVAGLAGLFMMTTLALIAKLFSVGVKETKNRSQSRRVQTGQDIAAEEDSVAVSNHTYASVQGSNHLDYQQLVRNQSRHPYDQPSTEVADTPVETPPAPTAQVVYAEVIRPGRSERNSQKLPDVVVHDYKNVRQMRRLS